MEHVFFAKFPRKEDAEGLLRELDADGKSPHVSVDVVRPESVDDAAEEMPLSLMNVRKAALKGLLGGGLAGVAFGVAIGWAGIAPSVAVGAALSGLFGALAGTLGAVLVSTSDPDENLETLAHRARPGEVIVGFHAHDLATEEDVVERVRRAGGEIVPRAGLAAPPRPPGPG
jgi:hypothetical protein